MEQSRALLNIDLLTYIRWIDDLIGQKGLGESDWPEFRKHLAAFFDSMQDKAPPASEWSEDDEQEFQMKAIGYLAKLHRIKAELTGINNGKQWMVNELLEESYRKTPWEEYGQMRVELEEAHLEMLEQLVDRKKWFRRELIGMG